MFRKLVFRIKVLLFGKFEKQYKLTRSSDHSIYRCNKYPFACSNVLREYFRLPERLPEKLTMVFTTEKTNVFIEPHNMPEFGCHIKLNGYARAVYYSLYEELEKFFPDGCYVYIKFDTIGETKCV